MKTFAKTLLDLFSTTPGPIFVLPGVLLLGFSATLASASGFESAHLAWALAGVAGAGLLVLGADLWIMRHAERTLASGLAERFPAIEVRLVEARAESKAQAEATRLVLQETLARIHSQLVDHLRAYDAVSRDNHRLRTDVERLAPRLEALERKLDDLVSRLAGDQGGG